MAQERGRKAGLKTASVKRRIKRITARDAATNRVTPAPRRIVFMSAYAQAKYAAADPIISSGNAGNLQTNTDPSNIQ